MYLCLYETETNYVYVENAFERDIRLNTIMVNAASLASISIGRAGEGIQRCLELVAYKLLQKVVFNHV